MRLIQSAPLAAAVLLAACGGNADTNADGTVSGEEIAAEAAGAIRPQPGQYRATYEMLEFDAPGAPAAMRQQMQTHMGGASKGAMPITYCLTPEDAEANGPEAMAKNMAEGNCTMSRFDVSGGSISAEMQCDTPGGGTNHVMMDGSMTSTGSMMTMTNETDMAGLGKVHMKMRVTAERIGDCPA